MTRPRLLDLFCGAGPVEYRCGNTVRRVRQNGGRPAVHETVLLQQVLPASHSRLSQIENMSTLWRRVPGRDTRGREPLALLKEVRQNQADQGCQGVAGRAPGADAEVCRRVDGKESRSLPREVPSATHGDTGPTGWVLCCLWGYQPVLASRRLHPHDARSPVPASSQYRVRAQESRGLPSALCQSPLRADPHRLHRGNCHHSVIQRSPT